MNLNDYVKFDDSRKQFEIITEHKENTLMMM